MVATPPETRTPGPYATHTVDNQPPPLTPYDASADAALLEGLRREGAAWAEDDVRRVGRLAGSEEAQAWADQANRYEPELRTVDRYGHRVDEVDFHPSWHQLMRVAVAEGGAGSAWAEERPGAHTARIATSLVWNHTEAGHGCPVSMTYAVVPALRAEPSLAARFEPLLTSRVYDPGLREPTSKRGLLAGMGMTEKQGGSDVRTNSTTATPAATPIATPAGDDDVYTLRGHKWFTSAPMCDLFLVLAQAPGGLTCFLVPRILPDGTRNTFRITRLKDKLGNRSNASSEPEFDGTVAWRVGEEGRGVKTIIEMVNCTRLDCVAGSAGMMRKALVEAGHHVRHRAAFGATLIDQPLMRNVIADLALESEAATTLALRLAGAVDRALAGDEHEQAFRRIATGVGKFWVTKRGAAFTAEALECLGGNGYVEDSPMPRLYREAPLNSVWEGSGNVNALDVLRALGNPATAEAFFAELGQAAGANPHLDDAVTGLGAALHAVASHPDGAPVQARRLVEQMALTLQGSLLVRHAPAAVSDAFCASRLGGHWGHTFGTLDGVDLGAIIERALPHRV